MPMISDRFKIYLAGRMGGLTYEEYNGWRNKIEYKLRCGIDSVGKRISSIKVFNPANYYNFEEKEYKSQREVMNFDLNLVKNSDVVIVNANGVGQSTGTCIEMYEAYQHNIPILGFWENPDDKESFHPWIETMFTRVDDNMDELVRYVTDFYFTLLV